MTTSEAEKSVSDKSLTTIIYALYAASLVFGVTCLVAIIINYVKRDDVAGTWLESHFRWQIRTFWFSLLWGVIGLVLTFVAVGVFVLFADLIWYIYRIVKGWIRLNDGKPMYAE
ncbi:MAG: hypothetical protein KIS74_01215 [Burkholderiales bacterium]|nr:hypothetical protein [Burkholderiales bacterium]